LIQKAISIAESFEVSRQFWSYLVQENKITAPENFIKGTSHEFCLGAENVAFLKKIVLMFYKPILFSDDVQH
jgi:malate dehydrogenase (quinone)